MRKLCMLIALLWAVPVSAQITIPNTFTPGTTILSSQVNDNFTALGSDSLNRTGGAITGNITVSNGVTIDGVDLSAWLDQSVKVAATPTFAGITDTGTLAVTGNVTVNTNKFTITAANGNTVIAGTLTAGSGAVGIIDSTGKIPALSSTYIASLDGTNLTGIAKLASDNTFTNKNNFKLYTETKSAPMIGGGALTFDLSVGTHFEVALNGNATVTISNPPSSSVVGAFTVKFTADGTLRTITWPGSVVWANGTAPTLTSTNGKVDIFTFLSYDGGTTWYAFTGGQNF